MVVNLLMMMSALQSNLIVHTQTKSMNPQTSFFALLMIFWYLVQWSVLFAQDDATFFCCCDATFFIILIKFGDQILECSTWFQLNWLEILAARPFANCDATFGEHWRTVSNSEFVACVLYKSFWQCTSSSRYNSRVNMANMWGFHFVCKTYY